MFDREVAIQLIETYPILEIVLQAGVVSTKMVRELLDVDRWFMQEEIYPKLLLSGAIKGVSSSTFRATPDMLTLLAERKYQNGLPEIR